MPPRTAVFDDDDFEDLSLIIDAPSSPISSPTPAHHSRKRARTDSDTEDHDDELRNAVLNTPTLNVPAPSNRSGGPALNANTEAIVMRFVHNKRMRTGLVTETQKFLKDIPEVQQGKMFALMLLINDRLSQQEASAPPYEVSNSLQKNIDNYASAVLLSAKLTAYKGEIPTKHLLNILKKRRFDMPAGIERNAADWAKVVSAVQETFTQRRAKYKKLLAASLRSKNGEDSPAQHQDIYSLAQAFASSMDIKCEITIALCARIALLRKVYIKDSGITFWDRVDAQLSSIRKQTNSDSQKLARVFRKFLDQDRKEHGQATTPITDIAASQVQQEVDDLIEVNNPLREGQVPHSEAPGNSAEDQD